MPSIEFSNEQYLTLLRLAYLGNWVVNSNRVKTFKEYDELEELLFSHAKKFGLDHLVIFDSTSTLPNAEFEEDDAIQGFLKEYDDNIFWHELQTRLADKEYFKTYNHDARKKMNRLDYFKIIMDIEDKYQMEFQTNGLKNFEIIGSSQFETTES